MEITLIVIYIGVVFSFIGLLSFSLFDDFEEITNISVAIKSGSTVTSPANVVLLQ